MARFGRSFRDPAGVCCLFNNRVLRFLPKSTAVEFSAFVQSSTAREFEAQRRIVSTRRLADSEFASLRETAELEALLTYGCVDAAFEHERIVFPSYPYEWPPEMLWEAARLTLELASASLDEGFGLKDATPNNVLFRGSQPVFVDLLSFERRLPGDPVWRPYGQFVRTFVLPLLCNRKWGTPLADILMARRDGLEPQEVYRLCSPLERLRSPFLSMVSMPTWLNPKAHSTGKNLFRPRVMADPEKARFVLHSLWRRLGRTLESLEPPVRAHSKWSGYMDSHPCDAQAFSAKERFVASVLGEFKPRRVLDVGANTGHFSVLAAKAGAGVVAIDSDPACVGATWRRARQESLNILSLVVDFGRPSPGIGWRNSECWSFLDRATGAFDCVLMLALIHHLLVSERIPLEEILKLASELTTSLLVVEFVRPEDEMFQQLSRGREALHAALNEVAFEQACGSHFEILGSLVLPGTHRNLYALKKKRGGP